MQRFTPKHIEDVNEVLHGVGLNVYGQQLEAATDLGAELLANQIQGGRVKFLTVHFETRVHFLGDIMPGHTPFAVMSSGDSTYHGDNTRGHEICGFGHKVRNSTDVHWVGTMSLIYVPTMLMRHHLECCGADRALERMQRFNAVPLDLSTQREFLRMQRMGLQGQIQCDEQILDMLHHMLNGPIDRSDPVVPNIDFDLASLQAVVKAVRANAKERKKPLQMPELLSLDGITVGQTKLNKLFKDNLYGSTAVRYQKLCRMQELYLSLADGEFSDVKDAIKAHRFNSNKIYKEFYDFFGVSPSDLLPSRVSDDTVAPLFGAVA